MSRAGTSSSSCAARTGTSSTSTRPTASRVNGKRVRSSAPGPRRRDRRSGPRASASTSTEVSRWPIPIEVLLKFAFIAVLYLFLLWVARSALKDLRRRRAARRRDGGSTPALGRTVDGRGVAGAARSRSAAAGCEPGSAFVVGLGLVDRPRGREADMRIEDTLRLRPPCAHLRPRGSCLPRGHELHQRHLLNGRRVSAQELLRADDRIRIGDTEFRYEP